MAGFSFQTFTGLFIVFGLLLFLYVLSQRFAPRFARGGRRRMVQVVEATPLGDKRNLLVVEVRGRLYLLGSTTQGISLLTDLGPGEVETSAAEDTTLGEATGELDLVCVQEALR